MEWLNSIWGVVTIAFIAGAVGTLIGGLLGVIVKKPTKNYIGYMLGFAAGAMLAVALFELLPEAVEHGDELFRGGGIVVTIIGLALGALFVFLFEPKKSKKNDNSHNDKLTGEINSGKPLENFIDKKEQEVAKEQKKFKRLGIAVFVAIILHDFPEGLAIGAGAHIGSALIFGAVLLLHNIPEGLAIAVPLKASGMNIKKILVICFAAGLPTLLGAIIGYYMGGATDWLLAFTFAFAAGVMLYVVLSEMLPTAYEYAKNKKLLSVFILTGAVILIVFATILHH
ncbi:MAG: ZIP family metal transporter [Firmicutes bacterium]|nr:ZIP family metal transporter [Bacillota bacterium]